MSELFRIIIFVSQRHPRGTKLKLSCFFFFFFFLRERNEARAARAKTLPFVFKAQAFLPKAFDWAISKVGAEFLKPAD